MIGQDKADVAPIEADDPLLRRGGSLDFISGVLIGTAAGLIGVGGGEFRIPVLLNVLRLPVKVAAGVNMVIGLFTVTLSVARRWGHQRWTADALTLGAVAVAAKSLRLRPGCGSRGVPRLPTRRAWVGSG